MASEQADAISDTAQAIWRCFQRGGKLILFGNGGSATDANDWMIDCIGPPAGYRPIPAVSLALEPANITAVANDVGTEVIFLRQLIAQARPEDVVVAISTSGGSRNLILALEAEREAAERELKTAAIENEDRRNSAARTGGFPGGGAFRLHPTDSSAGVDLSHHPGTMEAWPVGSQHGPQAAPAILSPTVGVDGHT